MSSGSPGSTLAWGPQGFGPDVLQVSSLSESELRGGPGAGKYLHQQLWSLRRSVRTGTALSPPLWKRAVPQVSHHLEDNLGVQLAFPPEEGLTRIHHVTPETAT